LPATHSSGSATRFVAGAALCAALLGAPPAAAQQAPKPAPKRAEKPVSLPTGQEITPYAARDAVFETLNPELAANPGFRAANAVTTATSPDGRTLLVLTSGYNRLNSREGKEDPAATSEFVFVFDISRGKPVKKQVLHLPNTYFGLAWRPDGRAFYVSGGMDDTVHVFKHVGAAWKESLPAISLRHEKGLGLITNPKNPGKADRPIVAGLAVNPSGTLLLAANFENDSVSLVNLARRRKIAELDLRPGKNDPSRSGVPGGEFPFSIVWPTAFTAFVTSERDREIVELDLRAGLKIARRIALPGQPSRIIADRSGKRLFIALHSSDRVAVVDTQTGRILETIPTTAPPSVFRNPKGWKGSNPNGLVLSPDERLLFVTNGGANDVAVISLHWLDAAAQNPSAKKDKDDDAEAENPAASHLIGLIPTGWYPTSVSVGRDGRTLYVSNSISPAGPVPRNCRNTTNTGPRRLLPCNAANEYVLLRRRAGLLALPVPAAAELAGLTAQVAQNNHWTESPAHGAIREKMALLRSRVHHVIYILKENRTYDQVLGDLEKGNGDPRLTLFPEPLTPNHHQLARQFVTLDNFYASGGVSGEGWNWSTAARVTEPAQENVTVDYADRGLDYDFEGTTRGINVGDADSAERRREVPSLPDDPDLLPGTADMYEPERAGEDGGAGYLWDGAQRAGLSLRNYGFFLNLAEAKLPEPSSTDAANAQMPWKTQTVVAHTTKPSLRGVTDPYFHGFDQRQADFYLYQEWAREFDGYERNGNLPALTLLRLPHDHFGNFKAALSGVNTIETQMADNDYAIGLVAEKVSHSRYKDDTLIFITEDDAQDGPDHVDAQRTLALVLGPYARRGALVATRYSTVHFLRTMEELLGIEPLSLFDASVEPMADLFDTNASEWSYTARVPEVLRTTQLPLPPRAAGVPGTPAVYAAPRHDAAYWEEKMGGLDFSAEDRLDAPRFNRALWEGLKGEGVPYPEGRDARDLRQHRERLLRPMAGAHGPG
jgi:DNA-binding beta-propeller fold protein YncE